jgi:peptide deformylase
MALLEILRFPDPRLRTQAKPVAVVNDEIRQLADDLLETMYAAPGIGLAATQVDVHLRVIAVDVTEERDQPLIFINPEILERGGEETMEEGCLSVPGSYEKVTRPEWVRVRALDTQGELFEMDAEGLLAVCIQHEMDHLDGKLFVDYLSALKRQRIRKRLEKEAKKQPEAQKPEAQSQAASSPRI